MKSFRKPQPHLSRERFEAWKLPELDSTSDAHSAEIQEQILAVFQGDGTSAAPRRKSTRSALHSSKSEPIVATWQFGDMELQASPKTIEKWSFLESFDKLEEELPQEVLHSKPDTQEKVEAILGQARAQAEEILLGAQAAAEKILVQSQEEIALKKNEGYEQGQKDAHAQMKEAVIAIHAVVEETRQWQAAFMAEAERTLVTMLKEMAQTMFGEGVTLDANALQVNLNRIMENAQRLGDLNIFLNPRDAALLDSSWSEYQLLITGNKVRIIPSEKITPGGCVVKGSMGMVDARVETQLSAVMSTIEELNEGKG